MDVRVRFRMQSRAYDERTCLIVVQTQDNTLGLVVDAVNEVVSIPEDQVANPQQVARQEQARYIRGIGKSGNEVKIVLDAEKLLNLDEQAELQKLAA
jgi:purine-binding chemotaxis protein CheW